MIFQTSLSRSLKRALLALSLALLCGLATPASRAQNAPQPRREQLLNGLNVLIWQRAGDPNVLLKLRIHSGAAFDLAGKAGTIALLGDSLFPDPATREYFTEDLKGRLEVATDYDALNITLSGPASEFENIVDLLHTALIKTQPSPEVFAKLREARSKMLRETPISPSMVADRAIAQRLFGDYPYGRPAAGSAETLARIERGDLIFAQERFSISNNATLVVIGGVAEKRALKALRQLLGIWRKNNAVVPATFRQPEAPDARTLLIDLPGAESSEVRLAVRGLSRSDRDYAAALVLSLLVRDRWQAAMPELARSAFFVRHEAHVLPGIFVMGASVRTAEAGKALATARGVLRSLSEAQPSPQELERVRAEALAVFNKQAEQPETLSELWLDAETFKLPSITEQARAIASITPADIQRVVFRIFRDVPTATVAVGSASELKATLEGAGPVELLSERAEPKPAASEPAKTPANPLMLPVRRPNAPAPVRKP
ncbi:MAG TPA: insulinase family protein [Pyrinomonadaceae bacterium]|jgi:zinc protease